MPFDSAQQRQELVVCDSQHLLCQQCTNIRLSRKDPCPFVSNLSGTFGPKGSLGLPQWAQELSLLPTREWWSVSQDSSTRPHSSPNPSLYLVRPHREVGLLRPEPSNCNQQWHLHRLDFKLGSRFKRVI